MNACVFLFELTDFEHIGKFEFKYRLMKITNVFYALLLLIAGACASSSNESGKQLTAATAVADIQDVQKLLDKHTCSACHRPDQRLVGPSYRDIAARKYSVDRMIQLVYTPEPQNWPDYPAPMIGLPHVPKEDLVQIANYINSLK